MSKTVVLHVIEHLNVGGRERMLIKTLMKNDPERILPIVVTLKKGILENVLRENNIEVIQLNPRFKFLRIFELIKIIKNKKVTVVHTHLFSAGFWGRIAAFLAGVPKIIHTHGTTTFTEKKIKRLLPEILLTLITNHVICVSKAVSEHLIEAGLQKKNMVVIPNAIDIEKYPFHTFNGFQNPIRLVGVGRLEKVKGWDILFHSMKILKDEGIETRLQLAGFGSMEVKLKELSQQLSLNVEFLGLSNDIPKILKNSDILVAPSFREGLSSTILEAMASGLPVIATNVGGNIELLDRITPLIPCGDSDVLAKAIKNLFETETSKIKDMLSKARMRVLETYTTQAIAKQHIELATSAVGV